MNKFQLAQRSAVINMHQSALRVELARHEAVKQTLALFPPKLRPFVNLTVSDYGHSVQFSLSLRDLDSFKDKKLTKLLEKFADEGWQSRSVDYTHSDTPNRDFSFTRTVPWTPKPSKHTRWIETHCGEYHIPTSFDISINLFTYVKSDSPMCRVVVTDVVEKVVREEVKQIVCA